MEQYQICKALTFSYKLYNQSVVAVSHDSAICIPTDTALLLIKMVNNPYIKDSSLSFKLTNIPPEETFIPDVKINRSKLHNKFKYENMDSSYKVMMDRTISPGIKSSVSYKGFITGRWSPPGADCYGRLAVAALTADHRLSVYTFNTKNSPPFQKIYDLSEEFNKVLLEENFTIVANRIERHTDVDPMFASLEERSYALAAVDVVWSDLWTSTEPQNDARQNSKYSLVIVAMKSGHLVLWKVTFPVTKSSFELLEMVDMCQVIPSCMKVVNVNENKCVLFVGFIDGRVKSFNIVRNTDSEFEVTENTSLWTDADKISISKFCWIEQMDVMLIAKGMFMMAYKLDLHKNSIVIDLQNHVMVSEKLPITDICSRRGNIVISVLDETLFKCHLSISGSELKIELENFTIQRTNTKHKWGCYGVDLSLNAVYLYEMSDTLTHVDHLSMKEPLQMNCLQFKTIEEVKAELMEISTDFNNKVLFSSLTDYLVCLRHYILKENCIPSELINFCEKDDAEVSLNGLRLKRYILVLQMIHFAVENKSEYAEKIEIIEQKILLQYVCYKLKCLVKASLQPQTLSENDITSICLMCKFVQNCKYSTTQQTGLASTVCKVMNLSSDGKLPLVLEKCKLCNADIPTKHVYKEYCPNGHNIGRCVQSLIICQDLPYRSCENCSLLCVGEQIKGSEWFEDLKTNYCTLCDGCVK